MSKADDEQQARLERAREVGLFRYMLIREAADPTLTRRQRGAMVRAIAAQPHTWRPGLRVVGSVWPGGDADPLDPGPVDPGLAAGWVRRARAQPTRPSIVNGQIAAALAGQHGNEHFTRRTHGSSLFINPLMAIYFTFDVAGVAKQNLYLDRIENTIGMRQVAARIAEFRNEVTPRLHRAFAH